MEFNKFIFKNFKDEKMRFAIFLLRKKCKGKVLTNEDFFKKCDSTIYYVFGEYIYTNYKHYKNMKENFFDTLCYFKLVECLEQGIRFNDIIEL